MRLEPLGSAVAALCPSRPFLDFMNRIYGRFDPELLPAALALYREHGLRPWLEALPGDEPPGWEPLGTYSVLAGAPVAEPPGLEIREDRELFGRTFAAAVGAPETDVPALAGWPARLYVCFVEGRPAAAGALALTEGLGFLANAATVPELRGRGAQTALIRRRLRDSAAAGCGFVFVGATAGSQSERNLLGAGLRVVGAKTVWRAPE